MIYVLRCPGRGELRTTDLAQARELKYANEARGVHVTLTVLTPDGEVPQR